MRKVGLRRVRLLPESRAVHDSGKAGRRGKERCFELDRRVCLTHASQGRAAMLWLPALKLQNVSFDISKVLESY